MRIFKAIRRVSRRRWRRFLNFPALPFLIPRFRQRNAMRLAEKKYAVLFQRYERLSYRDFGSESLFLHIPKAGGISIRQILSENLEFAEFPAAPKSPVAPRYNRLVINHLKMGSLFEKGVLDHDVASSGFMFTVVRNPFRRSLSLYQYLMRRRTVPAHWSFEVFLEQVRRERPLPGLAKAARFSQAAPQVEWLREVDSGTEFEVFKLENLATLHNRLTEVFSVRLPPFGWENRAKRGRDGVEWSEKAVSLVREIYEADFVRFNYDITSDPRFD